MEITEMLDELKSKARRDEKLRAELLETRKDAQPLSAFCRKCRELGYEIYDMDLIKMCIRDRDTLQVMYLVVRLKVLSQ